jgi:alpha-galactosidase
VRAGAEVIEAEGGAPVRVLADRTGETREPLLSIRLEVAAAPTGAAIELAVRNTAGRPLRLRALLPLVLESGAGAALRLGPRTACVLAAPGPEARALRVGFSNAVPPVPIGPRDREDEATLLPVFLRLMPRALARIGFDEEALPARKPGRLTSAWFTVLRGARRGPALALGMGGFRSSFGRFHIGLGAPAGASLTALAPADDTLLAPGEEVRAEPLLLAAAPRPHDALAAWAALAGRRAGARPRPLRYWCTWYAAPLDRIDERFVATCARALARRRAPLDFVVVDDGWQAAIGDWTATNHRFPHGLAALAAGIRAAGFRPGIWLAPFAASPRSRVLREHPDWAVGDPATGRPIAAGLLGGKGLPRPYFALDLTREDVLDHIAATLGALRAAGFELFKVDFLTAGAVAGRHARPERTRARAYADGMAAVRRGAGEDAALLGAIAPLAANTGHVDAQRVGADVAFGRPALDAPLARLLGERADRLSPSVRNALRGMLALAALDGRLFAADGDCVVARGLARRTGRALARASLLACSVIAAGDDPRRGPGDALAALEAEGLGAGPTGGVRVLDLLDRPIPRALLAPARAAAPARLSLLPAFLTGGVGPAW